MLICSRYNQGVVETQRKLSLSSIQVKFISRCSMVLLNLYLYFHKANHFYPDIEFQSCISIQFKACSTQTTHLMYSTSFRNSGKVRFNLVRVRF